jgi:HD-GYP domain-containing protein (c-di-GMP phosphodiesterase class II)
MKVRLTEENALSKAVQVATLAIVMGQRMGLDTKQLNSLTISALLYDIGNFWIDRKLLTAPRVFD